MKKDIKGGLKKLPHMKLPKLTDLKVDEKRVLVRADLDDENPTPDSARLKNLVPTLSVLAPKAARIVIIGHRGRPKGEQVKSLSLKPTGEALETLLAEKWGKEPLKEVEISMMENLRFNPGEEANDENYVEHLAQEGDFFINEAFAASHRAHASIVSLPKFLPHAAGLHFEKEVANLSKLLKNPKKPFIAIIGGVKKDKLNYVESFKKLADKVLIAGRLPEYLDKKGRDKNLVVARLLEDKEGITVESIKIFEKEIKSAGSIFLSGPIGKFEDKNHQEGTKRVLKAISLSSSFKVAGGGETQKAISMFGFDNAFDWISSGGGASLEFLTKGTLPGIEALLD